MKLYHVVFKLNEYNQDENCDYYLATFDHFPNLNEFATACLLSGYYFTQDQLKTFYLGKIDYNCYFRPKIITTNLNECNKYE